MNTIVLNLETLAVTEHDRALTGVAGDYQATATGVEKAEGDADDDAPITAALTFGLNLTPSTRLQRPRYLYAHHSGGAGLSATVEDSQGNVYEYTQQQRTLRTARFALGRGIRDGYLKFGLNNTGDEPFTLDRVEFDTDTSTNRRI
jgi:hypothetical protein